MPLAGIAQDATGVATVRQPAPAYVAEVCGTGYQARQPPAGATTCSNATHRADVHQVVMAPNPLVRRKIVLIGPGAAIGAKQMPLPA